MQNEVSVSKIKRLQIISMNNMLNNDVCVCVSINYLDKATSGEMIQV